MSSLRAKRIQGILRRSQSRSSVNGLEYNSLNANSQVNRYIYSVDIARTPYVISGDFQRIDVQERVAKVNSSRSLVDYRIYKIRGRSLI